MLTRKPAVTAIRVLVVDDSSFMRGAIARHIQKDARFQVVGVAVNGREAVVKAMELRPDVITMDVEMPEMDGLTAAAMIRGLEEGGNTRVPILAMTAHVVNSVKEQCLDAGMDGYISKPIQPAELYQALETYCPHLRSEPSCP